VSNRTEPDTALPASRHPLLTRLHDRAAKAGWRCLSDVWQSYHTRYAFECGQGHWFDRLASVFLYRDQQSRCEMCEQEAIRERWMAGVAARGGTLLNGLFTGLSERYRHTLWPGSRMGDIRQPDRPGDVVPYLRVCSPKAVAGRRAAGCGEARRPLPVGQVCQRHNVADVRVFDRPPLGSETCFCYGGTLVPARTASASSSGNQRIRNWL
jgi:hypothetical protein